jgi:uncharacterized protein (DUF3820 family)
MSISEKIIIPFGKHKGKKLANVPASYLIYLYDEGILKYGTIKDYVKENEDMLREEAKDG